MQLGSGVSPQNCVPLKIKVFGAQSCLTVAWQFDQVTFVCEEYSSFQDSKLIFMISDFQIYPVKLLKQLNFDVLLN